MNQKMVEEFLFFYNSNGSAAYIIAKSALVIFGYSFFYNFEVSVEFIFENKNFCIISSFRTLEISYFYF